MSRTVTADPLSFQPVEGPDRVHYAQGVLLDAQDFRDEQTYHRGRLARALKYLCGPGTVAGLGVEPRPATGETLEILVRPGLAIDPLGRLIELPRPACLRVGPWYASQDPSDLQAGFRAEAPSGVVADVFIRFVACERGRTPAIASGPFDALDAVVASRVRDGYELELVVRPEPTLPALPDAFALGAGLLVDPNGRRQFQDAVLGGWEEGTDGWREDGRPALLPEHLATQEGVELLLARVRIPADAPSSATAPPARRLGEPVAVDNHVRRFVYGAGHLARWATP
ncbi:hypothetical protein ACMHYB_58745 [Sorangium sp. So ce1128]